VGTAAHIFDVVIIKTSTPKEYPVGAAEIEMGLVSGTGTNSDVAIGEATGT
jgi:hypothetical protein